MLKSDGLSFSRAMDRLNDWPVMTIKRAITTQATGEKKKARSSLPSRMKKVRMISDRKWSGVSHAG